MRQVPQPLKALLTLLDTAAQGCLLYLHNPMGWLVHITTEPEARPHAAAASFEWMLHPPLKVLQY